MSANAIQGLEELNVSPNLNANLGDWLNNFGASKSGSSIGSYRSGNTQYLGSNSNFGLFKSVLLFAGVYLIFKLLKRGK